MALLCLAAILILLMCVLIMFDTSKATQAKIDVQMGADTAAYSAGATGARAMNMVAFANVGKRTTVGINNMYVFTVAQFSDFLNKQRSLCCSCFFGCWTCGNYPACFNYFVSFNRLIQLSETIELGLYALGNDLHKILEELDEFQLAVKDIAKAWSVGEAQVRGVRNNANMMVVWPDPVQSDDRYNKLPIERSDYKSESCLTPQVPPPVTQRNPTTQWTTAEFRVNQEVLVAQSQGGTLLGPDGPKDVHDGNAYKWNEPAMVRAALACAALEMPFLAMAQGGDGLPKVLGMAAQWQMPDEAAPMYLDVPDETNPWWSGDDQLRMSYMLFSYKHVPELGKKFRNNYEFLSADQYQYSLADNPTLPEGGVFGMARGEFYFPPDNQPDMFNEGEHQMWMFHPGWMGKLRPVMLPYETTTSAYAAEQWKIDMDEIVSESIQTGATLANSIFNIGGVPNYDSGAFQNDQDFLEKNVARDMVGASDFGGSTGSDPHHFIDGTAK